MKFFKFIIALGLLPAVYSLGRFGIFLLETSYHSAWPWMDFLSFTLGFSTCCFSYLSLMKGNWFYVFGHEATHAVAVYLSKGRVFDFKVSSEGGHIMSDRNSMWIALSPYFIPFYALVFGITWALLLLFFPAWINFSWLFLLIWGASWGFHACHTVSLLKTNQPDFESQGFLFSYVIIALMNLIILQVLIWCWTKPQPLPETLIELGKFLQNDYFLVVQLVKSLVLVTFNQIQSLTNVTH